MKNILLITLLFVSFALCSCVNKAEKNPNNTALNQSKSLTKTESLQGAWTCSYTDENGNEIIITTLVMDGFLAETYYDLKNKKFIKTFGGSWTVEKNIFSLTREFSSSDSTEVGKTKDLVFTLKGDTITFQNDSKIWTRIEHGSTNKLAGAWLFSGRIRDGEMSRRKPGPRKTMKILTDTRFQWIAFNTETGKFSGTGGGSYTSDDGKYIETIEFFSRDNSRVGASLSFDFQIKEKEWHHSGLSSKGNPIYEIWSPRKSASNN